MMNNQRKADEREARKHLIMDGALSVFHDQGIDGTTMEQIANEAGFGTASLYYYFPKKEDVFSAIMVKGWEQLWASCQTPIESNSSPKEKNILPINVNILLPNKVTIVSSSLNPFFSYLEPKTISELSVSIFFNIRSISLTSKDPSALNMQKYFVLV